MNSVLEYCASTLLAICFVTMSSSDSSSSDSSSDSSSEEEYKRKRKPVSKGKASTSQNSRKSASGVVKKRRRIESDEDSRGSESSSDESDSSSDSSSDEDVGTMMKKSKNTAESSSKTANPKLAPSKKSVKTSKSSERFEEARKAYKWWEVKELPDGINWKKLEHNGVVFAPNHIRHFVPLLYDSKRIELTCEQEELATFYAAIPDDGPQLGNAKTKGVFQKNFFVDFKATLPAGHVIQKFDKCDFSLIKQYLETQKSLRKAATDEEKLQKKALKEDQFLNHGYALIDGRIEKVCIVCCVLPLENLVYDIQLYVLHFLYICGIGWQL